MLAQLSPDMLNFHVVFSTRHCCLFCWFLNNNDNAGEKQVTKIEDYYKNNNKNKLKITD